MNKLFTIAALLFSSNVMSMDIPVVSTGSLARKVVVTYPGTEMEERSYEGKCYSTVGTRLEDDSFDYTFSTFACKTGIQSDGILRFKIEGQNVYKADFRGDIEDDQEPVGTYINDAISIQLSEIKKRSVPTVKLDENGCPALGFEMKDYELKNSLKLTFIVGEKSVEMKRVDSTQKVVRKMKKVDNCRVPYYPENIIENSVDSMNGSLTKRVGNDR